MQHHLSITEQLLLESIRRKPELVNKVDTNKFFLSNMGKSLFSAYKVLFLQAMNFTDEHIIMEANRLNSAIDQSVLDKLSKLEVKTESFDNYHKELKKNWARESMNGYIKDWMIELSKKTKTSDSETLQLLEGIINKAQQQKDILTGKDTLLISPGQMYDRYVNVLYKRGAGTYKYSTGCPFLDQHLRVGFSPGKMTFIFGASGTGKSSYDLYLIDKQIKSRIPCVYVSPENDTIMTADRLIAMRNNLHFSDLNPSLENGMGIDENVVRSILKDRDRLMKSNLFYFVEEPSLNYDKIKKIIQDAKKAMNTDYLIIHIDLMTMLAEFSGKDAGSYEAALNMYHELCRTENVHLIGVIQAGKQTDNEKLYNLTEKEFAKFRPTISHIKNSNAFRERGRIVLSVFRKRYYAETFLPEHPFLDMIEDFIEVQVLKQNEGQPGGKCFYLFDKEFYNIMPFDSKYVLKNIENKEKVLQNYDEQSGQSA